MKIKDIIRKQTSIVAIAVVLVAISVVGVSYAIFFDVKANSDNQIITAGNLKLTIGGIESATDSNALITVDSNDAKKVTYTIENTASNLPAIYSLYLDINTTDESLLNYIRISKNGETTKTIFDFTDEELLNENEKTYYKIESGSLNAGESGSTNTLDIWLDEDSISNDIIEVELSINLYVISEVDENQAIQ